jgi:hypothetical protein
MCGCIEGFRAGASQDEHKLQNRMAPGRDTWKASRTGSPLTTENRFALQRSDHYRLNLRSVTSLRATELERRRRPFRRAPTLRPARLGLSPPAFRRGCESTVLPFPSGCPLMRAFSFRWRRGRDSNPRYAFGVHTLSRRAPSTARSPLRFLSLGTGSSSCSSF